VLGVKEQLRLVSRHEAAAAKAARPWEERLAAAESRKRAFREEVTPEQRQRVQDALDNLLGADLEFRRALDHELEQLEPRWSWWARLAFWARGRRGRLGHRRVHR
jgi:hypothetical protein